MAEKYFIVIDVQNDFVTGALGTREAEAILPKITEKARSFDGRVLFTLDTHFENYLETSEGRKLPVKHCIKGTWGHALAGELRKLREERGLPMYEKYTFGSVKLAEDLKKEYDRGEVESITLAGLCTDICVVSNALLLKAYMPEAKIAVDSSCSAGVTPELHAAALDTMHSCQIEIL